MELEKFAKTELELLGKEIPDEIKRKIMNSIETGVLEKGLDGYENLVERLQHWKPLSPLTGEPDEWTTRIDAEEGEGESSELTLYQNKRCPFVFKVGINGKPYNSEGREFRYTSDGKFKTNRYSAVYIEFPYTVPDSPKQYEVKFINMETNEEENLENVKVRYF